MGQENPSPQDILKLAGENRPIERTEIGIEAAKTDKTVQGGHIKVTFSHDGKKEKMPETQDGDAKC